MSEAKKYFYLKVKETFFDSEEMKILESQKNGIAYQNLYMKLALLSLKSDGALLFRGAIPYDEDMLSSILRVDIDTVRVGVELFKRLHLVDVLDDGTMYLSDLQALIGRSSTEGERVKAYRDRIKGGNELIPLPITPCTNVQKCTPELELELEKELDSVEQKPASKSEKKTAHKYGEFKRVILTDEDMEKLKTEFPLDWQERIKRLDEYIEMKGEKYKNHLATIRVWSRRDQQQKSQPSFNADTNDAERFHDPLKDIIKLRGNK